MCVCVCREGVWGDMRARARARLCVCVFLRACARAFQKAKFMAPIIYPQNDDVITGTSCSVDHIPVSKVRDVCRPHGEG